MDSVQIYDELPAQPRPRKPLANWTSVRVGNNSDRPISNGTCSMTIMNMDMDKDIIPSEETESVEGEPIYSDDDISTSGVGLEDGE